MIHGIKLFIKRFKIRHSEIEKSLINDFRTKGVSFFQQYSLMRSLYHQSNLEYSHSYNIFKILKFKRPEEDLHSQFLSDLLNPNGKHGQKELFYIEFLKEVIRHKKYYSRFINNKYLDYQINTEVFVKTNRGRKGRIDIQIKSLNPSNPFVILIENKWDSPDSGFDQIAKYYKSKLDEGYLPNQVLLIYLTKKGGDPKTKYLSPEFKKQLEIMKNQNYFPIKFSTHIKTWLSKSMNKCQSKNLNFIINQYLNII